MLAKFILKPGSDQTSILTISRAVNEQAHEISQTEEFESGQKNSLVSKHFREHEEEQKSDGMCKNITKSLSVQDATVIIVPKYRSKRHRHQIGRANQWEFECGKCCDGGDGLEAANVEGKCLPTDLIQDYWNQDGVHTRNTSTVAQHVSPFVRDLKISSAMDMHIESSTKLCEFTGGTEREKNDGE